MAERLAGGNVGIALLCNSLATGAMLYVLITILGPVSGAHFNPAVTLVFFLRGPSRRSRRAYVACQIVGAVLGTWVAHLCLGSRSCRFPPQNARNRPLVRRSRGDFRVDLDDSRRTAVESRTIPSPSAFTSFCLLVHRIDQFRQSRRDLSRSLTDTFAGIHPAGVPAFVLAQLAGALLATVFSRGCSTTSKSTATI